MFSPPTTNENKSLRMKALLLLILALLGSSLPAVPARASCLEPREAGEWTNVASDTRGVVSLNLRFICQDHTLNGAPYPPGPEWYVHAVGKCAPVDCDWHEVGARRLSSTHIYAVFEQSTARRYVYLRLSQSRPDLLWAWIYTDFKDPTRSNYGVYDWFRRVER
jgi:hypothetical protein